MKNTTQERIRTEKLAALRTLGIDPYPARSFPVNTTTQAIATAYPKNAKCCQNVVLAGRILSKRIMGGTSFAELQDSYGTIQLAFKKEVLCPKEDTTYYDVVFKKLLDIGDIIGVHGYAFFTKTGQLTIQVTQCTLLSKAITPLPVVKEVKKGEESQLYYTFSNPESRYRQRYLDLLLNPATRKTFRIRNQIMRTMRNVFDEQGYMEVETPILQPIYGGASARPFTTHHHALDIPLFLRISNELYLKRLIIGGIPGVYEFAKDFRNEGMSRFHNPEFTMLELYVPYKDYHWMMEKTEQLFRQIVHAVHGRYHLTVGGTHIDFEVPFQRFTLLEAIQHFTSIDLQGKDEATVRQAAAQLNVPVDTSHGKGKLLDAIFGAQCEPQLIQPTFITDYPVEMSPLAKQHPDNPELVERFELICNGKEICNAFSELNDPIEQRKRFEAQLVLSKRGDDEAMVLDEDFLTALQYGMPPTVGIGIGIDRLVMLIADQPSIQEVIFFPQMRNVAV